VADFQFNIMPATVGSIVAKGDSDSVGCRFGGHGVVDAETISPEVHELNAFPIWLLKAP
jgi:hypothetical protein